MCMFDMASITSWSNLPIGQSSHVPVAQEASAQVNSRPRPGWKQFTCSDVDANVWPVGAYTPPTSAASAAARSRQRAIGIGKCSSALAAAPAVWAHGAAPRAPPWSGRRSERPALPL